MELKYICKSLSILSWLLLIEPYGIEIDEGPDYEFYCKLTFNRTLWN